MTSNQYKFEYILLNIWQYQYFFVAKVNPNCPNKKPYEHKKAKAIKIESKFL